MFNSITECSVIQLNSRNSRIEEGVGTADIKIDNYIRRFSGDALSRACFGSNYAKGEQIFQKLDKLQHAMSKKVFFTRIPGMRYFLLTRASKI